MTGETFSERMKRKFFGFSPSWQFLPPGPSSSHQEWHEPSPQGKGPHHQEDIGNDQITIELGDRLGDGERGAVLPNFHADLFQGDDSLVTNQFPPPRDEIRTAVIFFEKFDVPQQNIINGCEWKFADLSSLGLLKSSNLKINSTNNAVRVLRDLPFSVFKLRDEVEPGRWTIARPAQALGFRPEMLRPSAAVALTLQNALPIFTREVPLEDVLEFKHNRAWDELIALRSHLDNLCASLAVNGSADITESPQFARFRLALSDYIKLMNESNRAKAWRSLRATCNIPNAVGAAAGAAAHTAWTGSLDLAAAIGGAVMIGVKTVDGLRRHRDPSNPFEYLMSAHLDL